MVIFDELREMLILRLYEWANNPSSSKEISGAQLVEQLSDKTGPGIAKQISTQLLNERLLLQTRAISDEAGGYFEITPNLIRAAEKILQPVGSSQPIPSFKGFRNSLLIALAKKGF